MSTITRASSEKTLVRNPTIKPAARAAVNIGQLQEESAIAQATAMGTTNAAASAMTVPNFVKIRSA